MAKLKPRYQRFVDEVVKGATATQAAITAGFAPKHAASIASRLQQRPEISAAIATRAQAAFEKAGTDQAEIIAQLKRLAFQDARKFFNEKGELKQIHELDDDAAAVLAGFDIEDTLIGKGDQAVAFRTKKLKRWDPLKALEMLCRINAMFKDSVTVNGDFADKLVKARERARARS